MKSSCCIVNSCMFVTCSPARGRAVSDGARACCRCSGATFPMVSRSAWLQCQHPLRTGCTHCHLCLIRPSVLTTALTRPTRDKAKLERWRPLHPQSGLPQHQLESECQCRVSPLQTPDSEHQAQSGYSSQSGITSESGHRPQADWIASPDFKFGVPGQ